jgi:very-short-patch-repair endonuclease
MPPSNYFQGGAALLNPTEEDNEEEQLELETETSRNALNNSLDLADSESLLVYAENCNYRHSYLKIHYRSQHPYLIDFSNHAFYGKRLIPMPAKHEYKPIQFIEVNGIYEDQVNRDEARQVVDILLNHIKPLKDGKYPSVGVATFNLYQRNLILEEIIRVRQQNPEYDKKISNLGSDLFVKNLENIQGDERDIMIISTTFGKRPEGTFRQNFGPIVQGKGYKLLNVIITRAKFKIYVCCSIPQDFIRQYTSLLQKSKNIGRGIFYAYLAYAKAVSENNIEMKDALLNELYENCESRSYDVDDNFAGSESPFEEEVYYRLAEKIGQARIQQQYRIGGFRIDLIIKSKVTGKPIIAIECDGAKYHNSNEAWAWDMFRQSQLEKQGFTFYRIWSTNWWSSEEKELKKLVDFIYGVDNKESQISTEMSAEVFEEDEIVPVTLKTDVKQKVTFRSIVTIRNPEGKILKVKFSKTQSTQNNKADRDGIITIYENSPLAHSIHNRAQGEICQLGLLEMYYEILNIEEIGN